MKNTIERTVSILKGVSTLDTMRRNPKLILLLLISIMALGGGVRGGHSTLDVVDPSFNPQIQTAALFCKYVVQIIPLPNGKILVAGYFNTYNRQPADRLVRLNADGTLDTTFNSNLPSGNVQQMEVQADGKILVLTQSNLLQLTRLNADGTLDTTFNFNINVQRPLAYFAIDANGRIIIIGNISINGGTQHIIRLNSDGSPDTTFQATSNSAYTAVATQGNKIVVGSQAANTVQRLNEDGTIDSSFITRDFWSRSIIVKPDGKILTHDDSNLRRLNQDGSDDTGFQITPFPFPPNVRRAMTLSDDGKITLAVRISSAEDYQIRRLLADGTADSSFTTYTAVRFGSLAAQADGGVLIGDGDGLCTSHPFRNDFVRLSPNGSPDPTFNTGIGFQTFSPSSVRGINVQPDGKILIGGAFNFVNDVPRFNIARVNVDSTLDTSFQINTSGTGNYFSRISSFDNIRTQSDGKIVATGGFDYVLGGVTKSNLVRLNSDGSIDPTFILGVPITNFYVDFIGLSPNRLVTFDDGKLLVGTSRYSLAESAVPVKLLATGERDTSFNANLYPQNIRVVIRDVAVQPDGKIIIGGYSGSSFLTRLNADGSLDATFQSRELPNTQVTTFVLLPNGKIVISEAVLISVNPNIYQSNVLRLNPDGTVDPTFNSGTGADGNINTMLLLSTGRIFVGGKFTNFNGQPRGNLAQLNEDGSVFTPTYNLNNEVFSLAVDASGRVFVGGNFTTIIAGSSSANRSYVAGLTDNTKFDFDGDGKTDVSIFRPSAGEWWYQRSSDGQVSAGQFGVDTDKIVPADYTGDGKTDIAIWRPSSGEWFILRSEDSSYYSLPFGTTGDIPAPADYDGDGKADTAVFRPSSGTWYINKSSGGTDIVNFGQTGDVPVVADYDGDGRADIAIYRPSNGQWWLARSTQGVIAASFGTLTDKPVQGDYTGDGKIDIAIWRPASGEWFILRSEDFSFYSVPFGTSGDIPAPGDYDGDGKFDTAVFRPSGASWYVNRTAAGLMIMNFGVTGDTPVPSAFVP